MRELLLFLARCSLSSLFCLWLRVLPLLALGLYYLAHTPWTHRQDSVVSVVSVLCVLLLLSASPLTDTSAY